MAGMLSQQPVGLLASRPMGVLGSMDQFGNYAPSPPQHSWLDKLAMTWPARLAQSLAGAVMEPGRVMREGVDDSSIDRMADLAGFMTGTPGGVGGLGSGARIPKGIKAYHATDKPFDQYDWNRLGRFTEMNNGGTSTSEWSSNLARLGPWASDQSDLAARLAVGHTLPVNISGKGKTYRSLDDLEAYIRLQGGPESARKNLVKDGYGHVVVRDEELGGRSFVSLRPETFSVFKPSK